MLAYVRVCVLSLCESLSVKETSSVIWYKMCLKQLKVKSMQSCILSFALLHINPLLMAFYLCYINFEYFLWFFFLKSCTIILTGFVCVLLQTSLATSSNIFVYSCALYHILASRWQCSSVYDVSQWPMKKQIIIKKKKPTELCLISSCHD